MRSSFLFLRSFFEVFCMIDENHPGRTGHVRFIVTRMPQVLQIGESNSEILYKYF